MKTNPTTSPFSPVKLAYLQRHIIAGAILDVGAGRGHYSSWVAEQYPSSIVTAIDQNPIETNTPRVHPQVHNLEQPIPLPNESFETVLAFDVIEHISVEQLFLKELHRVCKKQGVLIGSVPHDNDQFLPAYNLTFYHRSDLTHKRYYVPQSLQHALELAGFSCISINLEGGVSPAVIAEFFPKPTRFVIKKTLGLLRRIGMVDTTRLSSDLFFIAYKP